ncbi:glycosyltransferase [Bifidobacterium psychraerophilum]|uniref:glycosyltransferase n=2 Tax=Bifidobacterium psychraerophilum TaxID=218140 RepID=UPI0023F36314|nr:glycosyltransferase [Bifidobacterium psychraerophilum]MCI1805274.1 glycosyltransferase [Bifidobacterium psychraerophilum]MCI2177229.1 glycosyltransferase [Bifidobacterium psychraerophilum]
MKQRLLVTASTFPRWKDDTEPKFIYDLCMQLKEYYDVTVLVPAAPGALSQETMEGITVKRFSYFPIKSLQTLAYPGAIVPRIKEKKSRALLVPFFFLSQYVALRREMKSCDAILVNWIIPQGITQAFALSKPYVLTGLGGDVTSLNFTPVKQLKQRVISHAGALTVVSKDLRTVLQTQFSDTADTAVIPMGVDLTFFSPSARDAELRAQINKPIVLFVARLVEKKGARYLLEAMQGINAKLLIVGDGPDRDTLEKLADTLHLDYSFLGPKNKQELKSLYASCDVFVAPSVVASDGDKDGLPVAILEAMASGAPIVASDIAGIAEAVADGENGFLTRAKDVAQIHDAIGTILGDEHLQRQFSSRSTERARMFDFVTIGRQYRSIIDTVIAGRRKR